MAFPRGTARRLKNIGAETKENTNVIPRSRLSLKIVENRVKNGAKKSIIHKKIVNARSTGRSGELLNVEKLKSPGVDQS